MRTQRLQRQVISIERIVWLQRAVRLMLRAAWMGGAILLLRWAMNTWLAEPSGWLLWGLLILAVFSFFTVSAVLPRGKRPDFLWRMDRRLGLREQISAAWKVASNENPTALEEELVNDSTKLLPHIRSQVSRRGWNLRRDVQAALIVIILFLLILIAQLSQINQTAITELQLLPSFSGDPSASEAFPAGLPGLGRVDDSGNSSANDNSNNELGDAGAALSELGEALSNEAATFELGEALQQGELDQAADELEGLADELEQLSDETQQAISEAFDQAADQLPNQSDLQDDLEASADALQSGDDAQAGEALDELAGDLRALDEQLAQAGEASSQGDSQQGGNGVGAGGSQTGQIEPLNRLEGEGQQAEFEVDPSEEGVLAPTTSEETSEQVVSGEIGPATVNDATLLTGTLDPYSLPFDLLDVVATYFTPR
ncbi:MAG: hypothetical protein DWQ07_00270 [Chloroflexi bacterium]|nr:MAG: hypothetical protein DWQ07_00270 [Chloroflexota bacterium]MBL1195768.1 hypothetical protein [Chloroflexota bacterium]NOH13059.1 hypothetical protein [Chloroflexota bacterium]